jgi:hypothetical protein
MKTGNHLSLKDLWRLWRQKGPQSVSEMERLEEGGGTGVSGISVFFVVIGPMKWHLLV